ncbi:type VII secretion protein EsaA [Amphibacillus cookii]|uniref:type VII secretion protein EsaA n=1 Tax=Amphibacillus cookii TaxID=767787 RepID=UPI00195ECFB0|nr:type VII secretion protein EsaA [Amphibacillus cookii]MBM7542016.1 type VII secretion EsaA-like protein [Amphibacillus cookii]
MKKDMIKLIAALLVIIAAPVSYFMMIGDNPMQERQNATQAIAVVNEDSGLETDNSDIRLGEQILNLFEEESSYEWRVLGRSAAENGLQSQEFDAIVYIPSDFSANVMRYDEANPTKINFDYRLQDQLNTVNAQRAQREVERVINRTNDSITELYWYYVSTDMEDVRDQFDRILQAELDFQETMLAFYQPSSEDLATQITEQQTMINGLQSSIEDMTRQQNDQEQLIDQVTDQLTQFIDYVNAYEDYQEQQQQLLSDIQADAIAQIDTATDNQLPTFQQAQQLLNDHQTEMIGDMGTLEDNIKKNKEVFSNLETFRYQHVGTQTEDLFNHQSRVLDYYQQLVDTTALNRYQDEIISLRTVLGEEDQLLILDPPDDNPILEEGEEGQDGGEQETEEDQEQDEHEDPDLPSFEDELAMLEDVEEQIELMLDVIDNQSEPLSDPLLELQGHLEAMLVDIQQIQTTLTEKDDAQLLVLQQIESLTRANQALVEELEQLSGAEESLREEKQRLTEYADALLDVNHQLREQLDYYVSGLTDIIEEIEAKEASILRSNQLSNRRRQALSDLFDQPLYTGQVIDLLSYYAYLDQYQAVLIRMGNDNEIKTRVMENPGLNNQMDQILRVTNREQRYWDTLSDDLPTTHDGLMALEDRFTQFMADYKLVIEENQADLIESLTEVRTDAEAILQQIQQPETQLGSQTPTPETGTAHEPIVQNQLQINDQFGSIHAWLDVTEDSQSTITAYTDDLQREVTSVQSDADTLNQKWSSNVETTEYVRDDVFSVLGNTFVDGQSNDDVYDFLARPLELTNSTTTQRTESRVPPVVILFGVLLASLLIGYLSYYFTMMPTWLRVTLFVLLNTLVGFIISIFGLNIYQLAESSMIEWTVYTILLLFVSSAMVTVAFTLHRLFGWFIAVGMVGFFVTPLLALTTPNFSFTDPMSRVYMSMQYSGRSLFPTAMIVLSLLLGLLVTAQIFIERHRLINNEEGRLDEQTA